jgi:hypothetical protein
MTGEKRDWRELCEAASKEKDSDRLIALVSELVEVLDERNTSAKQYEQQQDARYQP